MNKANIQKAFDILFILAEEGLLFSSRIFPKKCPFQRARLPTIYCKRGEKWSDGGGGKRPMSLRLRIRIIESIASTNRSRVTSNC